MLRPAASRGLAQRADGPARRVSRRAEPEPRRHRPTQPDRRRPDHPAARRAVPRAARGRRDPPRPRRGNRGGGHSAGARAVGAAPAAAGCGSWPWTSSPAVLRHAARAADGTPEVHVVAGDALDPPIRAGSVDVALCSLVLHHLPEDAVVRMLGRLAELARLGFVVSDFRRGRFAWAGRLARHARGVPKPDDTARRAPLGATSVHAGGARGPGQARRAPGRPLAPCPRLPPGGRLDSPGVRGRACRLTRSSSGAGPAGAATAILLAEQGLVRHPSRPRALSPRQDLRRVPSPEGSRILGRLGVLARVEADGARPLRGMRILAPDGTQLVGDYPADGPGRGHRPHALAVRRRTLDLALVERARGRRASRSAKGCAWSTSSGTAGG